MINSMQWCRAYAWSYGPLAWLYPSEIQPLETRSAGLAVASFSNLLFSFVIAQTFLTMLCALKVPPSSQLTTTPPPPPPLFESALYHLHALCWVLCMLFCLKTSWVLSWPHVLLLWVWSEGLCMAFCWLYFTSLTLPRLVSPRTTPPHPTPPCPTPPCPTLSYLTSLQNSLTACIHCQ